MTAPSAWTTPPTDYERDLDRIERAVADAGFAPAALDMRAGRIRRAEIIAAELQRQRAFGIDDRLVPGISDGLRRTLIAMALTTIIAISLGAIAWVRFLS